MGRFGGQAKASERFALVKDPAVNTGDRKTPPATPAARRIAGQPMRLPIPPLRIALTLGASMLACAGAARAQSSTSGSGFNAGYGATSGQYSQGINVSRASDANGNTVIVDGVTQTGSDQSVFYSRRTGGSSDTYSGVGATGYGTAIGNNLAVSVQGSNNTVVVNSTQINNGTVSATTVLNGQVNIDGGG